jgi:hypothetical protein
MMTLLIPASIGYAALEDQPAKTLKTNHEKRGVRKCNTLHIILVSQNRRELPWAVTCEGKRPSPANGILYLNEQMCQYRRHIGCDPAQSGFEEI